MSLTCRRRESRRPHDPARAPRSRRTPIVAGIRPDGGLVELDGLPVNLEVAPMGAVAEGIAGAPLFQRLAQAVAAHPPRPVPPAPGASASQRSTRRSRPAPAPAGFSFPPPPVGDEEDLLEGKPALQLPEDGQGGRHVVEVAGVDRMRARVRPVAALAWSPKEPWSLIAGRKEVIGNMRAWEQEIVSAERR